MKLVLVLLFSVSVFLYCGGEQEVKTEYQQREDAGIPQPTWNTEQTQQGTEQPYKKPEDWVDIRENQHGGIEYLDSNGNVIWTDTSNDERYAEAQTMLGSGAGTTGYAENTIGDTTGGVSTEAPIEQSDLNTTGINQGAIDEIAISNAAFDTRQEQPTYKYSDVLYGGTGRRFVAKDGKVFDNREDFLSYEDTLKQQFEKPVYEPANLGERYVEESAMEGSGAAAPYGVDQITTIGDVAGGVDTSIPLTQEDLPNVNDTNQQDTVEGSTSNVIGGAGTGESKDQVPEQESGGGREQPIVEEPNLTYPTEYSKWRENNTDIELLTVVSPILRQQLDSTSYTLTLYSESEVALSGLDTSRADCTIFKLKNSTGGTRTLKEISILGFPVIRCSGESGYLIDHYIDYCDSITNGEKLFEIGNNAVTTPDHLKKIADFWCKELKAKRHQYTINLYGIRHYFTPGDVWSLSFGTSGTTEYISTTVEILRVRIEKKAGVGRTVLTVSE